MSAKYEMDNSMWAITEDGACLDGKTIRYQTVCDDEDGTFPDVQGYINLVEMLDEQGTSAYLDWESDKLEYHNGYCTVKRDGKYSDKAELVFDSPIKVCFGYIDNEPIVKEVSRLSGNFTHDFCNIKNQRQNKYFGMIEIYFNIETYHTK